MKNKKFEPVFSTTIKRVKAINKAYMSHVGYNVRGSRLHRLMRIMESIIHQMYYKRVLEADLIIKLSEDYVIMLSPDINKLFDLCEYGFYCFEVKGCQFMIDYSELEEMVKGTWDKVKSEIESHNHKLEL